MRFGTDTNLKQASSPRYGLRQYTSLGIMTGQMLDKWKSGVYHLLPMCHVDIEARIKFSASVYFLIQFLEVHHILMYNATFYSNFLYFYGRTE
jgi:hypothetical protein